MGILNVGLRTHRNIHTASVNSGSRLRWILTQKYEIVTVSGSCSGDCYIA